MSNVVIYTAVGLLVAVGIAVQLVINRRRHGRDHREQLEPILAEHGLTFISARWPGFFKVGPFPKIEVEVGRPQTRVMGVRGEYDDYRIVMCTDAAGNTHELWAKLEFEAFNLCRIRWRAGNAESLPPESRGLLEDSA